MEWLQTSSTEIEATKASNIVTMNQGPVGSFMILCSEGAGAWEGYLAGVGCGLFM